MKHRSKWILKNDQVFCPIKFCVNYICTLIVCSVFEFWQHTSTQIVTNECHITAFAGSHKMCFVYTMFVADVDDVLTNPAYASINGVNEQFFVTTSTVFKWKNEIDHIFIDESFRKICIFFIFKIFILFHRFDSNFFSIENWFKLTFSLSTLMHTLWLWNQFPLNKQIFKHLKKKLVKSW